MALPVDRSFTDELQKEIQKFLWPRQLDGQTKQKRRLVARGRLAAGLEMGGLGIQPPENTVQGFQQNLIQKLYKKINDPQGSLLPDILSKLLQRSNRPNLLDHVERLGPEQWIKTAARLQPKNMMLAHSFRSVATLLALYETDKDAWHHAAIVGHSKASKLFPFTSAEIIQLQEWDVIVVSQLFNINDLTGMIERTENVALMNRVQHLPLLKHKLQLLRSELSRYNFIDKTSIAVSTLALIFRKSNNSSRSYKKLLRKNLHQAMQLPPAYSTRERDGVYVPERQTFKDAFFALSLPFLSSKTKETVFQILNRTIWTNNKAFKSGIMDSPLCYRCDEVETMEHLLYQCPNYAEVLWEEFGLTLTDTISQYSNEYTARIELSPKEIVYNKPHPAILLRLSDKLVRNTVLVLIQEVKRDIIYRRMQIKEPLRQEVPRIRIQAHLLSVIRKLVSLLEYQGIVQNKAPITFLTVLSTTLASNVP